jgi:chemotaxis protein methyltransferase CheR
MRTAASRPIDPAERRAAQIEDILRAAAGITRTSVLGGDPEAAVRGAATLMGIGHEELTARLDAGDAAIGPALLEAVLIHESHFFRHPEQIEALKREVLERAPLDQPLSIWSAGCAAGEEPYTLAMALVEVGRNHPGDAVLATDISARTVEAARRAAYGEWSLRQLSPGRRLHFFTSGPGPISVVSDAIRRRVRFAVHELVRDPPPAAGFDVVSCRNVLVYLAPDAVERALRNLLDALSENGVLLLAPAEVTFARGFPLEAQEVGGTILLRKSRRSFAPPRVLARARPTSRAEAGPAPLRAPTPAPMPPARAAPTPPPPPASAPPAPTGFEEAREWARRGDIATAERLARELADRAESPQAHLLLGAIADARGDLAGAVEAAKRAIYLDSRLAPAHAALVGLYRRLGRPEDARRARRNALALLDGLDDPVPLQGVEEITVGALRRALQEANE